ncbi:MAG: hypothetical protein A3H49_03875 [Nitrospirae bacterium RIFCSPLOWO2_02_FULL_62_14]|nr:MAG: hypothetical protein A3A88_07495 [Nitrospirae bacterium RIFCSPLOWO2_01_FULL_62_17]OGW66852.1 MAG: hypothetical protein A3H49_03875 [Nitrospirae bacterium RIFCSPLOWO2_02_FULL_62_14]
MIILPKHPLTRLVFALWLTACLAVLVFAFIQREIHDMIIGFWYFMLFLTFPLGYVLSVVIGWLSYLVYLIFDSSTQGGSLPDSISFLPVLIYWVLFVAVGYYQWFVLLPRLVNRFRRH